MPTPLQNVRSVSVAAGATLKTYDGVEIGKLKVDSAGAGTSDGVTFAENGMTIRWEGTGVEEKGYDAETGELLVAVNPRWFRPTDVDNLWGDPTKAKTVLGWNPQKTSYEELVRIMARHDRELAKRERAVGEA